MIAHDLDARVHTARASRNSILFTPGAMHVLLFCSTAIQMIQSVRTQGIVRSLAESIILLHRTDAILHTSCYSCLAGFIRLYEAMILRGDRDAIWRWYVFENNLMEEDPAVRASLTGNECWNRTLLLSSGRHSASLRPWLTSSAHALDCCLHVHFVDRVAGDMKDLLDPLHIDEADFPVAQSVSFFECRLFLRGVYSSQISLFISPLSCLAVIR